METLKKELLIFYFGNALERTRSELRARCEQLLMCGIRGETGGRNEGDGMGNI